MCNVKDKGKRPMNIRTVLLLLFALWSPLALAADISADLAGFWKHAEEPGWIEIRMGDGVGSGIVMRNDLNPERVGRELLKGLVKDGSEKGLWRGQIYVERLSDYQNAEISLAESGRMLIKLRVGLISRTLEWISVDAVPSGVVN